MDLGGGSGGGRGDSSKSGSGRLEAGPVEEGRGAALRELVRGRKWGQEGQSRPGGPANRPF